MSQCHLRSNALAIQDRSPPIVLAVPRLELFDIVSQSSVKVFFPQFNAFFSPCPAEWIMEAISLSFYNEFLIARSILQWLATISFASLSVEFHQIKSVS